MWVEIVPVTVSLSWLYSKPWTSNNSFLLRTYTPQQPWSLVAHLCGLSHEPKVQRHSLPTTSLFAQETEHYLPWALFRFTVHASSSCFSQTKPASFKRSFFFFFWLLLCWRTEALSQNQAADPYHLRNPSIKQQQILLYRPLHGWQEGIQVKNSTLFTQQSPCYLRRGTMVAGELQEKGI